MKKRVLIVEDDQSLSRALQDTLVFEGFDVLCAASGAEALRVAGNVNVDLVLLDVALPDTTGFEICEPLRRRGRTAIIFLTARGQKRDKLDGLSLGADDYVSKPFDLDELLARIRAVLRRTSSSVEQLTLGNVVIDFSAYRATRSGRAMHLTRREFDLLRYLAQQRDQVVGREELLHEVWGYPDSPITRSVDHAVARLRKKVERDPHNPVFIHTVHGDGYSLTPGR